MADDTPLTKDERRLLREALLASFPREGSLAIVLSDTVDVRLDHVVSPGTYGVRLDALIEWLESEGKTREFIEGARRDNPGNPRLRAFEAAYKAERPDDARRAPASVATLSAAMRADVLNTLLLVPAFADVSARDALLLTTADAARLARNRNNARADFELILDALGPKELANVLARAADHARNEVARERLATLAGALRGELHRATPQRVPRGEFPRFERLLVDGVDARLSRAFFERGMRVGESVCALRVPRHINGVADGFSAFGTAWVIAPGLLLTNDHVVDARDRENNESRATEADCALQVGGAVATFDYYAADAAGTEARAAALLARDEALDFALLRLADGAVARPPLPVARARPQLRLASRLNIVQHPARRDPPRSEPQRYAVRNNFCAGMDGHYVRYLTDTEAGASGSPVLDDEWRVVALHHAAIPAPPQEVKTLDMSAAATICFHNEGIDLHAILEWLASKRPALHAEIVRGQGWGG